MFQDSVIITETDGTNINLPIEDNSVIKLYADENLSNGSFDVLIQRRSPFKIGSKIKLSRNDDAGNILEFNGIITGDFSDRKVKGQDNWYMHSSTWHERAWLLDGLIVPKLQFTQPLDGSVRYANLKEYIDRLLTVCELRTSSDLQFPESLIYASGYTDEALELLEATTKVPELSIPERTTLRDAINLVLKVINARVVLTDSNQIDLFLYNKTEGEFELFPNQIETESLEKNADYFGSGIEVSGQNMVLDNELSGLTQTGGGNFRFFKDELLIFSENGALVRTENKIYRIVSITYRSRVSGKEATINYGEGIFETTEYLRQAFDSTTSQLPNRWSKQDSLRYDFGTNQIQNLGQEVIRGNGNNAWGVLYNTAIWKRHFQNSKIGFTVTENGDGANLEDYDVLVSYIGILDNYRTRTYKYDSEENDIFYITNVSQGESFNDYYKYQRNLFGLAQRVNNSDIQIRTNIYFDLSRIANLLTFEKNLQAKIVSIEIANLKDRTEVVYQFTKRFNRIQQDTLLNQQERLDDIDIRNKTILRTDIYEEFIEFSFDEKLDLNPKLTTLGQTALMAKFRNDNTDYQIQNGLMFSNDFDNDILIDVTSVGGTGKMEFIFQFNDPRNAGNRTINRIIDGNRRLAEQGVPYTKLDGTLDTFGIYYGISTQETADTNALSLRLPAVITEEDVDLSRALIQLGEINETPSQERTFELSSTNFIENRSFSFIYSNQENETEAYAIQLEGGNLIEFNIPFLGSELNWIDPPDNPLLRVLFAKCTRLRCLLTVTLVDGRARTFTSEELTTNDFELRSDAFENINKTFDRIGRSIDLSSFGNIPNEFLRNVQTVQYKFIYIFESNSSGAGTAPRYNFTINTENGVNIKVETFGSATNDEVNALVDSNEAYGLNFIMHGIPEVSETRGEIIIGDLFYELNSLVSNEASPLLGYYVPSGVATDDRKLLFDPDNTQSLNSKDITLVKRTPNENIEDRKILFDNLGQQYPNKGIAIATLSGQRILAIINPSRLEGEQIAENEINLSNKAFLPNRTRG